MRLAAICTQPGLPRPLVGAHAPSLPTTARLAQTADLGSWFDLFSDVQSDPADPMPLAPTADAKVALGCQEDGQSCNVYA